MTAEIRKASKKANELISSMIHVASCGSGNGARYNAARQNLETLIGGLEEERRKLKKQIAELKKTKWKSGHPDHHEDVWVAIRHEGVNGACFYSYRVAFWWAKTERWNPACDCDDFDFGDDPIVGWCEISEFDLPVRRKK